MRISAEGNGGPRRRGRELWGKDLMREIWDGEDEEELGRFEVVKVLRGFEEMGSCEGGEGLEIWRVKKAGVMERWGEGDTGL